MTMATTSPSRQSLFTVEILDTIISFSSAADATRCSRVCKAWLEVSLDHIWANVPGFRPLFGILAPLQQPEKDGKVVDAPMIFSRNIGAEDWNRLAKFSRRVRSFTIPPFDGVGNGRKFLDDSVFSKVLATRPAAHFLPNLQDLVVGFQGRFFERADKFVFILNEQIKTLDFQALRLSSTVENVAYFMVEATIRAPNIRNIWFPDRCRRTPLSAHAKDIFPKFHHLESLRLSSCSLNAPMLSALSTLPCLSTIELFDWGSNRRIEDTKNIQAAFAEAETYPRFQNISRLTLQSSVSDIIAFLHGLASINNLVFLQLDVTFASLGDDLSRLLRDVSLACKNVRALHITRKEDFSRSDAESIEGKSIDLSVLHHLDRLSLLETFSLVHIQPLSITNQELASVVKSCRNLKKFRLHRDPLLCVGDMRSSLTLGVIGDVLDHGPSECLEELYLEVDGSVIPNPRPLTADTPMFKMERLCFGFSALHWRDVSKAAAYLASVVSPSCKMGTQFSDLMSLRKEEFLGEAGMDVLNERADMWKSVGESLDLLCAARRQKDQETLVLQRSISDLRQELEQLKEELSEATRQKGEHDSNYSLRSAFTPSDLGHGEGMDNDGP